MQSEIDQVYHRMKDDLEFDLPTDEVSEVAQFYRDKTIFITGVTGFLGKCLVEKLLRSCPELKHIYFMIRGKGKFSLEDRRKKFLSSVVFDGLRRINPNFENKITAISGDLALEDLGLSEQDRRTIENETNIIFHNAANVKFDVKISFALKVNVLGTKHMLDLAKRCKNLDIFMYISTAYSNCYIKHVEDKFYPSPATLEDVYDLIKTDTATEEGISEKEVEVVIGKFPNVYCYSKSIAENLVREYSIKDPRCSYGVYRPSVVLSAYREPAAGYVDNKNGPVLLFLGTGLGILHAAPYKDRPIDFIPSDFTINILIALTRDCRIRWEKEHEPLVYNYGSTMVNRISLKQMADYTVNRGYTDASKYMVWKNFNYTIHNLWIFYVVNFFFHFIPACLLDLYLICKSKEPKAVPMFMSGIKHIDKIVYFGNGNWRIHTPNSNRVIEQLNSVDKKIFYSDLRDVNWAHFLIIMWRGFKVYFFKEDPNDSTGPRKFIKLVILHYTFVSALVLGASYLFLKLFNIM